MKPSRLTALPGISLSGILLLVFACTSFSPRGHETAGIDKLTYHNNPQRTGWNNREGILTPQAVASGSFGPIWQSDRFDFFGSTPPRLFASPLYVDSVKISVGKYRGNSLAVLYAVTTTGYVYAVSAFARGGTPAGAILWRSRVTEQPCFKGRFGNLSTPVIDLNIRRLYVTSCHDKLGWRAHALDIGTGQESAGWPVSINHTAVNRPGINKNGATRFPDDLIGLQRGALNMSLDGSRLYVAFAGDGLGAGWIMAIDTVRAEVATAFSATAVTDEPQGGMWASGGPSVDGQGRVHIATGSNVLVVKNKTGIPGVFPESSHNWGQSIIQLKDDRDNGFELAGTYTPFNYCQTAAADIDLGSSGAVVIDLDATTTNTPHLLALGGAKQGNVYLLDREHMPGGLTKRNSCNSDPETDQSLLSPDIQPHFGRRGPINIFGPYSDELGMMDQAKSRTTLAYFSDERGRSYLFISGSSKGGKDFTTSIPPGLARLEIVTTRGRSAYLRVDRLEQTQTFHNPGSPVVTSNGGKDAIVWVLDANAPRSAPLYGSQAPQPVLYAFDASNLKLLWKSSPGELEVSGKYNEPTVVKGVAFVGTDRIQAFGLQSVRSSRLTGEREFKSLFDGRTLKGWKGDSALWSVEEGAITGKSATPIAKNTFLIHQGNFHNFELRFRYRFLSAQGNSGLQYRSRPYPEHEFSIAGYQANVVTPDAKERFGMLWEEHARELLAYLGEKAQIEPLRAGIDRKVRSSVNRAEDVLGAVKPYPAWNEYVVIAYENHLVHAINGLLAVDVLDDDVKGRAMEGVFALQLHEGPPMGVQFKDIEIKELSTEPEIAGRFATSSSANVEPNLHPKEDHAQSITLGESLYEQRCAMCHSSKRPGIPPQETLATLTQAKIVDTLRNGAMQTQALGLSDEQLNALAVYLTSSAKSERQETSPTTDTQSPAGNDSGQSLYQQRCAVCHDHALEQTPPKAFLVSRTHEAIVRALKSGPMQAQAAGLTAEQIDAVASYLTSLATADNKKQPAFEEPELQANLCKKPAPKFTLDRGSWNGWSPDPENTRFQAQSGLRAKSVSRLKPKWVFAYPGGRAYGPPSVAGGRVFIGTSNGHVISLDSRTGCTYWAMKSGAAAVRTSIIVAERSGQGGSERLQGRFVAYFGDLAGVVHAVNAETGEPLWSVRPEASPLVSITGSFKLHQGRLYVPTATTRENWEGAIRGDYSCCTLRGSLTALDSLTGKTIWKGYAIQEEPKPFKLNTVGTQMYGPAGASIWSPPTLDLQGGIGYATTGNSRTDVPEDGSDAIVAFDLQTGARRWSMQATPNDAWIGGCDPPKPGPNCPKVLGPDIDFGSPAILRNLAHGKRILVAAQKSGMVHALDPDANGKALWRVNLAKDADVPKGVVLRDRENPGVVFGMAADAQKLYVAIADPGKKPGHIPLGVYALNLSNGEIAWHTPGAPVPSCRWGDKGCTGAQRTAVTLIPGIVFAGSANGHMYAYDAKDGKIVWDFDTATTYPAVNGVKAQGGSVEGAATVVAGGALYVMSGYASYGGGLGNALLAFTVDGR